MRSIVCGLIVLFSISLSQFANAQPKQMILRMQVKINGKVVSTPSIATLDGTEATMKQESAGNFLSLSATATETIPNVAHVVLHLTRVVDGETIIDDGASIITEFGKKAVVKSTINAKGEKPVSLELTVTPTRI